MVLITTRGGIWLAPSPLRPGARGHRRSSASRWSSPRANAFNMYLERDVDALMRRTRNRPLPAGRLAPEVALCVRHLLRACWRCRWCALRRQPADRRRWRWRRSCSTCSPTRRSSAARPGARRRRGAGRDPAAHGLDRVDRASIDAPGLALFGVLFVWQIPHFIAISMFRAEEYARAGLKVDVGRARRRRRKLAHRRLVAACSSRRRCRWSEPASAGASTRARRFALGAVLLALCGSACGRCRTSRRIAGRAGSSSTRWCICRSCSRRWCSDAEHARRRFSAARGADAAVRRARRGRRAHASTSRAARSSASSARTAPASRPPSICSPACSRPTRGRVLLDGREAPPTDGRVRRRLGVVFQEPSLDDKLTGAREPEARRRALRPVGQPRRRAHRRAAGAGRARPIAPSEPVERYSGGMRRRLEIARVLLHEPEILIMDEPSRGIDAPTQRRIWEQLLELRAPRRMTILLTTHQPEEAEHCDRIAVLDHGQASSPATRPTRCARRWAATSMHARGATTPEELAARGARALRRSTRASSTATW